MNKWLTRFSHLHSAYAFLRSAYTSLRAAKDQISLEGKVKRLEARIAELEKRKGSIVKTFPKKKMGAGTCDACCLAAEELFDFPAPSTRLPDGTIETPERYRLCERCFFTATVPPDQRPPTPEEDWKSKNIQYTKYVGTGVCDVCGEDDLALYDAGQGDCICYRCQIKPGK